MIQPLKGSRKCNCSPCVERCVHFGGQVIALVTAELDIPLHSCTRPLLPESAIVCSYSESSKPRDCSCGAIGAYLPEGIKPLSPTMDYPKALSCFLAEAEALRNSIEERP